MHCQQSVTIIEQNVITLFANLYLWSVSRTAKAGWIKPDINYPLI